MLLALIKKSDFKNRDEHWKIGYLIHAYGDSFAHTFLSTNGTVIAYGPLVGHAPDLKNHPDLISQHIEKYKEYVMGLYYSLGGDFSEAQMKSIADFLRKVESAANNPCVNRAEKEVDDVIKNYIGAISTDLIDVDAKTWQHEIRFWKANSFLKQLKRDLKAKEATH